MFSQRIFQIPNAFIQAELPKTRPGEERVTMKITGVLAELLVKLVPETYAKFLVEENGQKVIYVVVLKALYGMLVAALRWYIHIKGDLISIGFIFNDYDPCVANGLVNGKRQTVCFHVDDLKGSQIDPSVNTKFIKWLLHPYKGGTFCLLFTY